MHGVHKRQCQLVKLLSVCFGAALGKEEKAKEIGISFACISLSKIGEPALLSAGAAEEGQIHVRLNWAWNTAV